MNFSDFKNIAIPDGNVKKIYDAEGNIMWGSQSDFPYRRLEYVICNGLAACDTEITPSTASGNPVTKFIIKIKTGNSVTTQQRIIANYKAGATYPRMYPIIINTKFQNVIGSNWGGDIDVAANTEYTIESSMYGNDRYITVNDVKTQLGHMNEYTATSGNTYGIGAGINKSNSPIFENGFTGYIYYTEMVSQNDNRHFYFIPVQRKSDNKVGFLKFSVFNGVNNNDYTFLPSTWSSEFGAGPVVNEYFDPNDILIPGSGWHTLWEGNYKITSSDNAKYDRKSLYLCNTRYNLKTAYGQPIRLKITFSNLVSEPSQKLTYINNFVMGNTTTTTTPTSPVTLDVYVPLLVNSEQIFGVQVWDTVNHYAPRGVYLRFMDSISSWDGHSAKIGAYLLNLISKDSSVCEMNITKIEQYC